MFYSQFILAKKGPLGTIWIAAHLERKLRKNQVADTDIGVSVDSILCPDVPIALRLSSHLLLGVVRIYSRKVNYLFHDCSEALLKVKQAFRSTAVDLPPEESTAPYHSITLPETFDLDDFELPDSFLHSNFVDHHVSTREQITLQDTIQRTGYSATQFGLDERFGDDNASQIGLNLDEELFLEKHSPLLSASTQLLSEENFDRQASIQPATPFVNTDIHDDQNAYLEQKKFGIQKDMPDRSLNLHDYNTRTPDLNEIGFHYEGIDGQSGFPNEMNLSHGVVVEGASTDLFDNSQGSSSSAFLAKANAIVQETPSLDHLEKTLVSDDVGDIMPNDSHIGQHCSVLTDEMSLNGLPCAAAEIVSVDGHEDSCSVQKVVVYIESVDKTDNCTETVNRKKFNCMETVDQEILVDCTMNPGGLLETRGENLFDDKLSVEVSVPSSVCDANLISRDASGIGFSSPTDKSEELVCVPREHVVVADSSLANHSSVLSSNCALRPCCTPKSGDAFTEDQVLEVNNSQLCTKEMFIHEETRSSLENQERSSDMNQRSSPASASLEIKEDYDKPVNLVVDIISNNQHDALQCSASSEYPEPERMLSDPGRNHGVPSDLEHCIAERGFTMSDESVGRLRSLSGRKRHLADGSENLLDGNSVNLPGFHQLKRNDSRVPDDDDLLASILVGKGTSLKVKSTPNVPLILSSKRLRRGPKTFKRKVLLDDAMVLHADTIRQQLMNTEDIRRIRKKVPCTRTEIWMIQKCLLEDEIFSQSVLIGMPPDLVTLHCKIYDPNMTFYSEVNGNTQVISDNGNPGISDVDGDIRSVGTENPNSVMTDVNRCAFPDSSNAPIVAEMQSENGLCSLGNDCQEKLEVMQNNAEHVFSGAQTCTILSEEVQHGDHRDTGTINAAFDTCSAMCPPFANKPNVREASALMDHDHLLPKMGLPDMSAESSQNGGTSDPGYCVWTSSDALHVSEARIDIIETHVSSTAVEHKDATKENEGELQVDAEGQNTSSSYHSQLITGLETITSTIGENTSMQESNLETTLDVENLHSCSAVARDSCDFGSAVIGNDTEFLNMDDDIDIDEDANYNVPDPEEAESQENSGWSARTRGVAKYLKLLFDDEYGQGRKIIAMDRLLMGKTRKEASRMFFETLVLKSRDYIHVEQEDSFKNISIQPGSKLLKSNF